MRKDQKSRDEDLQRPQHGLASPERYKALRSRVSIVRLPVNHGYIRDLPIFKDCHPLFVELLMNTLSIQVYMPGADIMREGDEGTEMFILYRGMVEVSAMQKDGSQRIIAQLGQGSVIGEMALFGDGRREATVKAMEVCDCRVIEHQTFRMIVQRFPAERVYFERMAEERRLAKARQQEEAEQSEVEQLDETQEKDDRGKDLSTVEIVKLEAQLSEQTKTPRAPKVKRRSRRKSARKSASDECVDEGKAAAGDRPTSLIASEPVDEGKAVRGGGEAGLQVIDLADEGSPEPISRPQTEEKPMSWKHGKMDNGRARLESAGLLYRRRKRVDKRSLKSNRGRSLSSHSSSSRRRKSRTSKKGSPQTLRRAPTGDDAETEGEPPAGGDEGKMAAASCDELELEGAGRAQGAEACEKSVDVTDDPGASYSDDSGYVKGADMPPSAEEPDSDGVDKEKVRFSSSVAFGDISPQDEVALRPPSRQGVGHRRGSEGRGISTVQSSRSSVVDAQSGTHVGRGILPAIHQGKGGARSKSSPPDEQAGAFDVTAPYAQRSCDIGGRPRHGRQQLARGAAWRAAVQVPRAGGPPRMRGRPCRDIRSLEPLKPLRGAIDVS